MTTENNVMMKDLIMVLSGGLVKRPIVVPALYSTRIKCLMEVDIDQTANVRSVLDALLYKCNLIITNIGQSVHNRELWRITCPRHLALHNKSKSGKEASPLTGLRRETKRKRGKV